MNKRNRIIVLVDFSEYSINLINFAFSIAKQIKAKIIFVHQVAGVVPALADEGSRNEILRVEIEEARLKLREFVKERIDDEDAFQVSPKPVLSILQELSGELYFDWILAGVKETGTFKRLLMGSTTLAIIDESDYLTMAVPLRNRLAVPQKLLVGVTPKFSLNIDQFENVLFSLKEQLIELEFFTILKDKDDEIAARQNLLDLQVRYASYKPEIGLYNGNDALSLLKQRVINTEDSFLVLQQGSRSLNDKLFRKFMINELVYGAESPLIVLSS